MFDRVLNTPLHNSQSVAHLETTTALIKDRRLIQ